MKTKSIHDPKRPSTKFRSLAQIRSTSGSQRQMVFNCIQDASGFGWGGVTRRDIAEYLDMHLSSVCGRVNTLIKQGIVYVSGETIDDLTGKKVELLRVVDEYVPL